VRVGVRKGC